MVTKVTDSFPDLVLVEQIFNDIKWLATVSNFRQISTSQSTHEYFGKEMTKAISIVFLSGHQIVLIDKIFHLML